MTMHPCLGALSFCLLILKPSFKLFGFWSVMHYSSLQSLCFSSTAYGLWMVCTGVASSQGPTCITTQPAIPHVNPAAEALGEGHWVNGLLLQDLRSRPEASTKLVLASESVSKGAEWAIDNTHQESRRSSSLSLKQCCRASQPKMERAQSPGGPAIEFSPGFKLKLYRHNRYPQQNS